jgi:TonB family protein
LTSLWIVLAALFAAPDSPVAGEAAPTVYEAEFAPLRKSERAHQRLGPAGPFYPANAVAARAGGEAVLECRVEQDGALANCRVVSESPARLDFGAAATVMAQRKRLRAAGSPPPGLTIRVRVPFTPGAPVSIAP